MCAKNFENYITRFTYSLLNNPKLHSKIFYMNADKIIFTSNVISHAIAHCQIITPNAQRVPNSRFIDAIAVHTT